MNYFLNSLTFMFFLLVNVTLIQSQLLSNSKILVSQNAEQFITGFNKTGKQVSNITIKISPKKILTLDFNIRKQKGEIIRFIGSVNQDKDSYYTIYYLNGKVEGEISLKDQNKAYNIFTSSDSKVYIEEIEQTDIENLSCYGFAKPKIDLNHKLEKKSTFTSQLPPTLESRPSANGGVIYLDFDGEVVEDTNWNNADINNLIMTDVNPINAEPAPYSNTDITSIWEIMAEDFSPFDINITTDRSVYNATPVNRRLMLIFTPNRSAIGGNSFYSGVARGRSFRNMSDDPAWVFTPQNATSAGQVGSHEVGHAMSLNHDGPGSMPGSDEYVGHGNWSAIMGQNNSNPIRQWSKGEYSNASNTQDDIDIIANDPNFVGFAPDDHGNTTNTATALITDATGNVNSTQNQGIIEQSTDIDMFSFIAQPGMASFSGRQFQYSTIGKNANLDIKLRLLDTNSNEIAVSNPSASMDATINHNIATAGIYYLEIEGVGTGNVNTGYSDYGSLGQFSISGSYTVGTPDNESPEDVDGLAASNITSTSFDLSWTPTTDNVAVTGYEVLVDGASQGIVSTGLSYTITGLNAATTYTISVIASDAAGNMSTQNTNNEISVSTLPNPGPDTEPPTTVTALTWQNVAATPNVYNFSWTASTDNIGVTGYNISDGNGLSETTSDTFYGSTRKVVETD